MGETLEMDAVDVSESAWEDVLGSLLTEDPDAITPLFKGDTEGPDVIDCGSFCSCSCFCAT